ncbi:non-ribosomal peptide synthetase [Pseudomonas aeruginosa]|uniref:non-ribosomal peptide synthetase n=6 Tax=Pseudomonas aeruginosa TaxID=287 RepID=UPI0006DD313B|nr:non-ribosomal peptide synthetase [Pseudomonas aeruginosa]
MSASEDLQSAVQPAASEALEGFPLSPLQTRAWRRHAERPENTVVGVRLPPPADPAATLERLRRALDGEAQLRVAYRTMPGMSLPVQVLDGRAADLLVERLPGDGDWAGRFARESARLAAAPLGGEGQPVLALGLLLDAAGETLQGLLLAAPAFVVDAASLAALLRRGLGQAGPASADEGAEALLFQHFSEWANEALAGEDGESASGYWREQAAVAAESPLALADDLGEGEWTARRLLPRALLERLAANGLPEAAALLAWTQVAGQFQGDEGLPLEMARLVSGRLFNEFAELAGPFAGVAPLCLENVRAGSVGERLDALQAAILAQEEAAALRDPFAPDWPLAELGFAWLAGELDGAGVAELDCRQPPLGGFLELQVLPHGEGRLASLRVRRDHDGTLAGRLLDAWVECLESIAADRQLPLAGLPLIGAAERERYQAWQGERVEPAPVESLVAAFDLRAALQPQAPALLDAHGSLDFATLRARSEAVAEALLAAGVRPGQAVAVMTGRNREAIVALLGVMRAAAVYTPVNPEFPAARVERMREAGGIVFALADAECAGRAREAFAGACLDLSTLPLAGSGMSLPAPGGRDAAYMIFTSGTSGQPKGVVVEHASALNLSQALARTVYANVVGEGLRVTVNAPFSFDSSIKQILQLLSGHCLVPVPQEVRSDPQRMLGFLEERRIDVLDCTPSLFRLLLQAGLDDAHPALPGCILVGGERFDEASWEVAAGWRRCQVFNLYGPTEATVNASLARVAEHARPTIGRALANVDLHVVDGLGRRKTRGASGELWIGGAGVARGYAGDAGEAAGRFLEEGWPGSGRLYRSGDLVRWRADGCLEFLGRIDEQVKINGYRIELGEIRSALLEHPAVGEAAVLTDEADAAEPGTDRRIVAFVTAAGETADESWLEVDLPSGHRVAGLNLNETEYVYQEIFVDEVYSRDGIVLPPDAVVLDVGANIGLFSLYIASRAPRARVVAFEPLAPIRRRLEANLGRYAPQVEVFGIGLSDAEREETFTYYPGYSTFSGIAEYADASGERDVIRRYLSNQGEEGGANLLLDNIDEILDDRLRAEAHRCRLRRLDQVIGELGLERIDLLKIDVQRAEMDVLLGLDDAALAKVRQIVLEVHDKRDGATAGRADALSDLLRRHGFEVSIRQDALLEGTDRYNCYAVRPGYAESLAERIDWRALAPRPAAALGGELSEQALRGFLEARLPAYMLPSRIARVERLPLTAEGKLDRRALLAALAAEAAAQPLEAPANATEAALLDIWKSVLKRPAIGVSDNFFQVGGDSIRLIQMQVMARQAGLAFTLRDVFNHQSIRELARLLAAPASPADAVGTSAPQTLEPFALLSAAERKRLPEGLDDAYPMTSLQQGMLLQSEASGDPRLLHNVVLHEVHGRLDSELLARAWAILIGRHAILRTGFDLHGGQAPLQWVHPATAVAAEVPVHDLRGLDEEARRLRLRAWIEEEQATPFDWSRPPLVRLAALALDEWRFALGVAEHHSVLDGWSLQSLVDELLAVYADLLAGVVAREAEAPAVGFRDYVALEREAEANAGSALFWLDYLAGARYRPLPGLAEEGPRRMAAVRVDVPADSLPRLRALAERSGLPLRSLLLAAHGRALCRFSDADEVVSGFVSHGRPEEPGADRLLGLFLNTLPCRLSASVDLLDSARRAFDYERASLEHRRHPLAAIRRRNRELRLDSLFNFVDFHQDDAAPAAGVRHGSILDQVVVDVDVPLAVDFEVAGERLEVGFQYAAGRFPAERAEALADAYREALLALLEDPAQPPAAVQAEDSVELRRVLKVLSRVLGRPLAADQGFASAGGHSLLGVQAIAELRRLTGRQLSLGLLQGDPDAREVVRRCHVADAPPLPPATERARALWLQRSGSAQPRLRLIALPPAGGNAGTFRGWDARLPADVELLAIQYPGRQERQDEPFVTDVEAMLCAIDDALLPLLDRPFALVGASLGGMLAYELAARLESLHGLRARQLFVISSRAPGPDLEYPRFHAMGDAELLRTLREYDVLPLEVLDDPELREISLATLRADSRLAADYRYRPREPLAIPITAILGEQDPGVSRAAIDGWRRHASRYELETLAGGHGLVVTAAEEVCAILRQRLAPDVPGGVPANLAT